MTQFQKIELILPIKTVSEANNRDHWTRKRKRRIAEQHTVRLCMINRHKYFLPCSITLTRLGPRIRDDDNNINSMKAIRDEVANLIVEAIDNKTCKRGTTDSDPRIKWLYAQEKGKINAIRITIEPLDQNLTKEHSEVLPQEHS